ncbi:MAG: hypothetical protein ACAI38_22600 [Myxococcota bacterium]|nr:hypothetical protein [Myxococcota bacterium]
MWSRIADKYVMTTRLLLPLLLLSMTACAGDASWERSRGEYCQEVELLANRTAPRVAALESALKSAASDPEELRAACARAHAELREVGALLTGVGVATGALAKARPDKQSLEEAGFHILRADVVQKFDQLACQAGQHQKAAEEVAAIKAALEGELAQALHRCQVVGWKSSLGDSRYK